MKLSIKLNRLGIKGLWNMEGLWKLIHVYLNRLAVPLLISQTLVQKYVRQSCQYVGDKETMKGRSHSRPQERIYVNTYV